MGCGGDRNEGQEWDDGSLSDGLCVASLSLRGQGLRGVEEGLDDGGLVCESSSEEALGFSHILFAVVDDWAIGGGVVGDGSEWGWV